MKIIIILSTRWEWLRALRISQAELYHFMVSHCGTHAYQATKKLKGIRLNKVYKMADYTLAKDQGCKTVQLYDKNYDMRRVA